MVQSPPSLNKFLVEKVGEQWMEVINKLKAQGFRDV